MRVTRDSIVDWVCSKTQTLLATLLATLKISKQTSARISCLFGSRTFVPFSWMCKKQTSVSHSSIESEVLSLDAGLRMDGIPAHDLWDLVVEVLHSSEDVHREIDRAMKPKAHTNPNTKTKIHSNREVDKLSKVDHVVRRAKPSHFEAQLYNFEDK